MSQGLPSTRELLAQISALYRQMNLIQQQIAAITAVPEERQQEGQFLPPLHLEEQAVLTKQQKDRQELVRYLARLDAEHESLRDRLARLLKDDAVNRIVGARKQVLHARPLQQEPVKVQPTGDRAVALRERTPAPRKEEEPAEPERLDVPQQSVEIERRRPAPTYEENPVSKKETGHHIERLDAYTKEDFRISV